MGRSARSWRSKVRNLLKAVWSCWTSFYRLGVRALSLTWNHRNLYADGVGEEAAGGGLTRAGRELVRELSRKGMILDLAHLSTRSFLKHSS